MSFNTAFNRLMVNEGGISNNPSDPGRVTKYGISQRSYPNLDIASLTIEDARQLYQRDFWDKIDGDSMPPGVGFQLLDFAVNSGIQTAIRALQRAIGVADDGVFGPVSMAALKAAEPADVIMRFLAERLLFMSGLSGWLTFGRGWARRIAADLRYGAQDTP